MYFKGSKFLIKIVSTLLIILSASMFSCSANYKFFVEFDKYENECKLFIEDTETGKLVFDGVKIFLADLLNFFDECEAWQEDDSRLETMKVNVVSSECREKIEKFLEYEKKTMCEERIKRLRRYRVPMEEETEESEAEEAVIENTTESEVAAKSTKESEDEEFIPVKSRKNTKRKKANKKNQQRQQRRQRQQRQQRQKIQQEC